MTNPCHTCAFFIDAENLSTHQDLCSSVKRRKYYREHYLTSMPPTNRKGVNCKFYESGVQMTLRDVFKAQGKKVGGDE